MAIKRVLKTEKDMIKFLNNMGIAKRLKFLARTLLLIPKKFMFKFSFKSGRGSYTDGKDIYIDVPEYLIGHSREESFFALKALTAHEVEHINSTSFDAFKEFALKFGEYFNTKHGIHQGLAQKVGNYLDNSIEDGRIERLTSERNMGLKKPIIYHRSLWWSAQDLNEKGRQENILFDTLFAICTTATMGQLPLGFLDKYDDENPELQENLRKWKKYIFRCVDCNTPKAYYEKLWQLVYLMEDWLVEELKKIPEPDEAEDKLGEMLKEFGEKSKSTHKTPKGAPMPSTPSKPEEEEEEEGTGKGDDEEENEKNDDSSDNEEDTSTENEDKSEEEQSLRDMFENLRDKKTGKDGNMKDIVKEAMKEAEEEINLDEGKTIIQAELDDKKIREDEAKAEVESDIESEPLSKIEEIYERKSWDASLKIHRNKFTLLKAEPETLQTAKRLKKEFAEIFVNKSSRDVKNKRKGNLDLTGLHKLSQGDKKLFEKKGHPNDTDYVFYVLVDGSGSMGYNKFAEAYKATAMLEECLGSLAPLKIVQFDCGYGRRKGSQVNHYIVKDFNDKKAGNYSTTFAHNMRSDNCNMDGFSIRVATEELKKRSEKRKVLIILSDGLPSGCSCYYGKEAETDVKQAIREARKENLDVFNIMFGSERERKSMIPNFKYMYEKGIVSCSPEEIGKMLCKIVKKELKK